MKPNILFIMADQFRADALGCVGGYARTPNLDQLAAEGFLFENAYANSAECIPSRISLATGLYPHQTGVDRNTSCTLDPAFPNWMQTLIKAGYATSLFGKTHLHPHEGDIRDRVPLMQRYGLQTVDETTGPRAAAFVKSNMTDLWEKENFWESYRKDFSSRFSTKPYLVRPSVLPLEYYYDCYVGTSARRFLAQRDKNIPWFCWVSFGGPHEPWDAPEPYASMYSPETMPKPRHGLASIKTGLLKGLYDSPQANPGMNAEEIAAMRANYAGNVTLIDDQIGKIIELIRDRGELDRTLIVFTSDHGEMNGDYGLLYKANFLDPAIKIPLIIRPPINRPTTGTHALNALVELMDVGVTIVDYAGGKAPSLSCGKSLRALLEKSARSEKIREKVICEFGGNTCVIDENIKVEFDADLQPVLVIDRCKDPQEQTNKLMDEDYRLHISKAKDWLIKFRSATPETKATCDAC
ncbi:MAG: hypothetical protein EBZ78_02345 [Verrucomicrobia bacterium]|nr:hypothetical protein [Verrucomicrobiota bacterium]